MRLKSATAEVVASADSRGGIVSTLKGFLSGDRGRARASANSAEAVAVASPSPMTPPGARAAASRGSPASRGTPAAAVGGSSSGRGGEEPTSRDEIDQLLSHYDSPSLNEMKAALHAGQNRPLRTPRTAEQEARLNFSLSAMMPEGSDAALRWKTAGGEVQAGAGKQAGIVNSLQRYAQESRWGQFLASDARFPFGKSKSGDLDGTLIIVVFLGFSSLGAYLLLMLTNLLKATAKGEGAIISALDQLRGAYAAALGEMPFAAFLIDILPLLYVSVLPLLCALHALAGLRAEEEAARTKSVGKRVLRRIAHGLKAVQAEVRMSHVPTHLPT